MIKRIKIFMLALLLGGSLCIGACGQGEKPVESSVGDSLPSGQGQLGDAAENWRTEWEKYMQNLEKEIPKVEVFKEEVPENVIVVGAIYGDYMNISKHIKAFNQAQSDYKVEVKTYETTDDIFLDLVKRQGCDLLVLSPRYLTILSDKGGLEDLLPYLDESEKVREEDLFDVALEVGTAEGRLVGILPEFAVRAILVEKGCTKNGGWTIEEYLALMDQNPDVPLTRCKDSQAGVGWLMSTLYTLPESFVDWEERTCSFESEDFVQAIETIKSYAERLIKTDSDLIPNYYEMLYGKQIQTVSVEVRSGEYFSEYKDIRDAFLGSFEGYPNPEGEVRYPMEGLTKDLYCVNAASAKKDAAWAFLEYLLSDYQETIAGSSQDFPVRRDILEGKLEEEIGAELTEDYYRVNSYSKEMAPKRGNFTKEDKERLLYMLDHASPPTVLQGGAFWAILNEELSAFFAGDKTAAETAHVIQSRVSMYLSE